MFGIYAMDEPPFADVFLHGLIRDDQGRKMSKSKGNGVDPLDVMDAYGSDALRFFLAHNTTPGGDLVVNDEWIQGSRNFCNKLWNASRFALMSGATVEGPLPTELSTVDQWILSRLSRTIAEVDEHYERFEFAKMADALYHFAWDDVCDWYLELTKPVLAAGGAEADATRRVLGHVLDNLLRLLHPVVPFITEELWLALTGGEERGESIMVTSWPQQSETHEQAEETVAALQHLVTEIRRFRADQGLRPGQRVATALNGLDKMGLTEHETLIRSLARLEQPGDDFTATATVAVTDDVTAQLDTRGTINVAAERARLEKALAVARKELDGTSKKLSNDAFLAKAPEEVVAKIRDRRTSAEADLARVTAQLEALPTA